MFQIPRNLKTSTQETRNKNLVMLYGFKPLKAIGEVLKKDYFKQKKT